jgi:hypothetical protein
MAMRYELLYSYKHCRSETVYSAGFVDSEEEAVRWVSEKNAGNGAPIATPGNDPVCTCEVSFCPMKYQRPWCSYRIVEAG